MGPVCQGVETLLEDIKNQICLRGESMEPFSRGYMFQEIICVVLMSRHKTQFWPVPVYIAMSLTLRTNNHKEAIIFYE